MRWWLASLGRVPATREDLAPRRGLIAGLALVALAIVVPIVTGWQVQASVNAPNVMAPLHAYWRPMVGIGTPVALVMAILGVRYAEPLALRLTWGRLLITSYAAALLWALSLAFVYGPAGISRIMESPSEYLVTARTVHDVPALLQGFVARIPLAAAPENWPIHVAGHPPGALLFFVLLVHLGLGSGFAAGSVVTLIGTTTPLAVLLTLRRLGAESAARRCAPFLVLGPAALWVAVSADGVFAAVAAWALACVSVAATATKPRWRWGSAALGALLLGLLPLLSYGLLLFAPLVLAVLLLTRAWRVLPVLLAVAVVPVLVFVGLGFSLWEAYPVLRQRYWDGLGRTRPTAYWVVGDLAALLLSAGPMLGAALGSAVGARRTADRAVRYLVAAAACSILLADASLMSKAEVERIWLPFMPWLLVATALLPQRWRRRGLVLQVVVALLIEHLLATGW